MSTEILKNYPAYKPKGKEEYMNARQLAHFRKMLEEMKSGLSQDIDRTVHTMQDEATIFADPNDRASQESDMSLELRNRDRERKLIKKIDETIARIIAKEYGYCDSCGVEIGLKRMEARPTAPQARTRGQAGRVGNIAIFKAHTRTGQTVDVWTGAARITITSQVIWAKCVNINE